MSQERTKTFNDVFKAELTDINARRPRDRRIPVGKVKGPTTSLDLTGIALSGGGVRSAAFCLGALQGLQKQNALAHTDYLSTVSGGGYIGTAMTIGMSTNEGTFPFGREDDRSETPELKHLRDNSRYLVQNGIFSVISAVVIYLRGITMNIVVVLPLLLLAAATLLWINPDTQDLTSARFLNWDISLVVGNTRLAYTTITAVILFLFLLVYALAVSIFPIQNLNVRRKVATLAAIILGLAGFIIVIELHAYLMRLVFESPTVVTAAGTSASGGFGKFLWTAAEAFAALIAPLIVLVLPFLKRIATTASVADTSSWSDLAKTILSRLLLLVVAAIVPFLLWFTMMQLTYWGTATSSGTAAAWSHAPEFLRSALAATADGQIGNLHRDVLNAILTVLKTIIDSLQVAVNWLLRPFGKGLGQEALFTNIHRYNVPVTYMLAALALFLLWPFLSVNANSLHQLYRDRLGSAFLTRRRTAKDLVGDGLITSADDLQFQHIVPALTPYHLINTTLNVPGSKFANRRGRNGDFFLFSRLFIGSDATGYVATKDAESTVDGLNIGTAMAISGAAAAPNMGMASVRPLSPTLAFLNVRLGRWVRHPRDIARHAGNNGGRRWLRRIPGPIHLLYEAFSKSGHPLTADVTNSGKSGFVFLTDGGHIDNLGIYELLRRRCRLIIAVDGEADPDLQGLSLVQVERLARIDLNVVIRMNWKPIAARTRELENELRKNDVKRVPGPHVAIGLIDYPPIDGSSKREAGTLIYFKASLSGDENDYVSAYKAAHPRFPHETTADQFFSEEQFEVYRALGEHIAANFLNGRDKGAYFEEDKAKLETIIKETMPAVTMR